MSVLIPPRSRTSTVRAAVTPSLPAAAPAVSAKADGWKAGPVGSGAGVLMTEYALASIFKRTDQDQMREADRLYREVTWVRAAERTVDGLASTCPWHLEDPDGVTIDETYPDARAKEALALWSDPQKYATGQHYSCRSMHRQTYKHQGVCGNSFWFRDQRDAYGIPRAYLYIRPDRLTPVPDDEGNLFEWLLDYNQYGKKGERGGTRLQLDDVAQVMLEPPDDGFFGVGLVVSALMKIQLAGVLDKHTVSVLGSGGRLSGIIAPKSGVIDNDTLYEQIVRDWRNVSEQPDAAKRAQVVRYPIDFIKTASDMVGLEVVKLLTENRDDLLALWGVPLSQIGGYSPSGLNSGDVRKYDRQALWENAIHPRILEFAEFGQGEMDRWEPLLGFAPRLVMDEPETQDVGARFDLLAKSTSVPMRVRERRDMIGLEPFGPAVIGQSGGPVDDEVWVPQTIAGAQYAPAFSAPDQGPGVLVAAPKPETNAPTTEPGREAPETGLAAKAKLDQAQFVKVVLADLSHQYPPELTAWVPELTWCYEDAVKVKKMSGEPGTGKSRPLIDAIGLAMQAGAPIDPLVLVCFPDGTLDVANGNKRYTAATEQKIKRLPAYVGTVATADVAQVRKCIEAMQAPKYQEPDPPSKASLRANMAGLKTRVTATVLPKIRATVANVIATQKRSIMAMVRLHQDHIASHPSDISAWWDDARWNAALTAALAPSYQEIAGTVAATAGKAGPLVAFGPATPRVLARVLAKGAKRVQGINDYTRDEIKALISQGVKDGLSPAALGDLIEEWSGWDEYRAERIATTELAQAYNDASLGSYQDNGVEYVQADDACTCEICQARFGDNPVLTVDEADGIEDHPNGTLEWLPVVTDEGQTIDTDEVPEE